MIPPLLPQGGDGYDGVLRQALARWFTAFQIWIGPRVLARPGGANDLAALPDGVAALTIGPGAVYAPQANVAQMVLSGAAASRVVLQNAGVINGVIQAASSGLYVDAVGGPLVFRRGGTYLESMRIDAGGRLLFNGGAGAWTARMAMSYTMGSEEAFSCNGTGTFVPCWSHVFRINGVVAGAIYHATSTTSVLSSPSDRRMKDAIVDAPSAIGVLSQLRVRSFDWRRGGEHVPFGLIAQELDDVYPLAVCKGDDDGTGTELAQDVMPWSVAPSALIAVLVKGFQEQQDQIAALQAALRQKG